MEEKKNQISYVQDLNIHDLTGEYNLIGIYNSNDKEIFQNYANARNFKVKITVFENEKQILFEYSYQDAQDNKPYHIKAKYNFIDAQPAHLQSPVAIMMVKYYDGSQDLIVHYFDKEKRNLVLVQADESVMYFLSKQSSPSEKEFPISKIIKDLGLESDTFIPVHDDKKCTSYV